jgi:hypothetical protein
LVDTLENGGVPSSQRI